MKNQTSCSFTVNFKTIAKLLLLPAVLFTLAGCVSETQSQQMDFRRELNALNVLHKGVVKKLDRLQKNTKNMVKDVESVKTGFASLEVETRSALAENNAELDKFREEFGFVRGGIEATDHINNQFREDIDSLKLMQNDLRERLDATKNASAEANMEGTLTTSQIREVIADLSARVAKADVSIAELTRTNQNLTQRIKDMEDAREAEFVDTKKKPAKDPAELYMEGYKQATEKNYTKALKILKDFISNYPKHELADKAQYWLAESYFALDDWERAILEFNTVIKKYPKSDRVASATFKQGLSFLRLGANKEAKYIFERVVEDYPDTEQAVAAGKRLKKMELQKK